MQDGGKPDSLVPYAANPMPQTVLLWRMTKSVTGCADCEHFLERQERTIGDFVKDFDDLSVVCVLH